MSTERIKTTPNLVESSPKHLEALAKGKEHFEDCKQYNVADCFKNNTIQEVKAILKQTANPFAVLFEHWIGDFNISTGIRNANAFNAREVFYLGDKKWDKRGSVGAYNYTDVTWLSTIEEFIKLKEQYVIVGVDNVPGSVSLREYQFVKNTLFVFGEEGVGLTSTMQSLCKDIVAIEQFGSVRSLNCGVASGIVMYDFINKIKNNV